MKNNAKFIDSIISIVIVILGNVFYAATVKFFLMPAGLIMGGSTGVALTLNHYFHLSVSTFVLIFNVAMLILGFIGLGKKFAMTTLLSTFAYPIALGALDSIFGEVTVTEDIILNTLFAGLGVGISVGMVIRTGASTGGMDIPVLLSKKYLHIPVNVNILFFDTFILLSQAVFNDVEKLLYGVVLVFIYSTVVDKVLLLGTYHTQVKIISKKSEEIKIALMEEVDRGVTLLNGRGGYHGEETDVILTVVSNREVPRVEKIALDIDEHAFMMISKISEVNGRGFSWAKK